MRVCEWVLYERCALGSPDCKFRRFKLRLNLWVGAWICFVRNSCLCVNATAAITFTATNRINAIWNVTIKQNKTNTHKCSQKKTTNVFVLS